MVWTIEYTGTVRKHLRKLDRPTARRILDFMDARIVGRGNPRATGKALTGPRLGAYWRYRVGDYRILCDIQDDALRILVIDIGNWREVYR